MSCPICAAAPDPRYRPFCGKRCADVDLHRWLSGSYALPVVEDRDRPDEDAEADGEPGAR